jgi:hypothetical protein
LRSGNECRIKPDEAVKNVDNFHLTLRKINKKINERERERDWGN